jgi:hypothetical protein
MTLLRAERRAMLMRQCRQLGEQGAHQRVAGSQRLSTSSGAEGNVPR